MKKIIQVGVEIILVTLAVVITGQVYLNVNLIPKFIFSYQEGIFSNSELFTILLVYVIVGFSILFISKFIKFGNIFQDEKFFVRELFLVFLSSTLASLGVFVFTKIFFDPNFMAWEILIVFILFIFCFIFTKCLHDFTTKSRTLLPSLGRLIPEIAKYGFSLSGVCIILISLLPVLTAVKFKSDKSFANTINTIRNFATGSELDWSLVPEYNGLQFHQPMVLRHHPFDLNKNFLLEREGRVFLLGKAGTGIKQLILDFSDRVGAVEVENGALGFDLHPDFGLEDSPNNGFIYVYYTDVHAGKQVNRVSRFDISEESIESRQRSETVLVEQSRIPDGFHNGGSVEFGPDGFLYFAIGDGSDKKNHQTISNSLFAGIFRIDVDRHGGNVSHPILRQPRAGRTENYMIPNDNPFVGNEDSLEEFWALGLRNPFRFSFDPETKRLWVGDVGAAVVEEVDIMVKGGNFQYPYFEGYRRTEVDIPKNLIGQESLPFFSYRHDAFERAIIGGMIYKGKKHKKLFGKYVFADNGAGQLYSIENMEVEKKKKIPLAKTHHYGYQGISSVYGDPNGAILITVLGSKDKPTGKVLKLVKNSGESSSPLDLVRNLFSSKSEQNISKGTYTIQESHETFMNNCARCHGQDGKGSMELALKLPDFSDSSWHQDKSDEHLIQVISLGGKKLGLNSAMPPWKGVLNDDEIIALVKFIRTLREGSQEGSKD